MLAVERQSKILDLLRQKHSARVGELAAELEVSEVTIRRDLDALARENRIAKVHGGATLPQPTGTEEPGFAAKRQLHLAEKSAIARAAAKFVERGFAIGLGAGTTTWALAHLVRQIPGITTVTNSPAIAEVLTSSEGNLSSESVILTGGIRTPSDALVGPLAVRALRDFSLDVVFLGAHGVQIDTGFTTPNLLEAETNRAFITAARRTIVLADHTKWGTPGMARFADLTTANALITDQAMPRSAQKALTDTLNASSGALIVAQSDGEK